MTDEVFPDSVKDFVFDLHDATRRSFIHSEQQNLYNQFRGEITAKYFSNSAWPSSSAIANDCDHDPLFLSLYNELALRHYQSIKRPSVRDRIEGWHIYRQLFDFILDEAAAASKDTTTGTTGGATLYLIPEWCFDILHEFLYQFQGFCQFRTTTYTAATKAVSSSSAAPSSGSTEENLSSSSSSLPGHIADAIEALNQNRDAWAIESVLFYLHRLVSVGTTTTTAKKYVSATHRYLAYFSSVTLSRLECLLGDYRASIAALDVIYNPNAELIAVGGGAGTGTGTGGGGGEDTMKSPEELVNSVFPARLSLTYHAGVSYLMLRRYKDAASILGGICLFMHRGFKTGQLRKIPGSEQFNKLFDRMIALLAILSHICPKSVLDDTIASIVREKHATNLSKIEIGEEGYEDLFVFACPKFVNAAVPDYTQALMPGSPAMPYGQDVYKLQVHHFMNEMSAHATLRKMRSYMTLYTSIKVDKLASFNDMKVDEFEPWLVSFKNKLRQLERGTVVGSTTTTTTTSAAANVAKGMVRGVCSTQDKIGTALDIHYNVSGDVVHVDEAEKTRRFETYFMKQISNNDDILRQLKFLKIEN